VNTNQVARTFQDRSYIFYVTPSTAAQGIEVINVNVRGKRGNIVQTYPAVEYDMIPNKIKVTTNIELDVQWAGSDYNPRRGCNDAEGGPDTGDNNVGNGLTANTQGSNNNARTDRVNLLGMGDPQKNYPYTGTGAAGAAPLMLGGGTGDLFTAAQAKRFAYADSQAHFAELAKVTGGAPLQCLTATEINAINNENRRENHPRNCAEGNSLLPYFATATLKFTDAQVGKNLGAVSARNNNFSNRDFKLMVMVRAPDADPNSPPAISQEYILPATSQQPEFVAYTEEEIELGMEADIPGFDPVENEAYGSGTKEGCTQDMLTFASAPAALSAFSLMVCTLLTALYTSL